MPSAVNDILSNLITAYNRQEEEVAEQEHREAELLPMISAHTMRHTACTRMAESGMDMKIVQYIMGHSSIRMTMEIYNHITDQSRVEREVAKMDNLVL